MHVNKHVELAHQGTALQKIYGLLLLFITFVCELLHQRFHPLLVKRLSPVHQVHLQALVHLVELWGRTKTNTTSKN